MLCCTEASPGGQTDEYCHGGDSLPHSGSTVTQNYLANTSKMWKNLKLWNANFCMPKIRWIRLWCVQFGRKDVSYDIHHISCNHNAFYRPDKTIQLGAGRGTWTPLKPPKMALGDLRWPPKTAFFGHIWPHLASLILSTFLRRFFFLRCSKLGENGQRF